MTEQEDTTMTTRDDEREDREIYRLTTALNDFRVEMAGQMGKFGEQNTQMMRRLDAVDGLNGRVSVVERDQALLRNEHTNFKDSVLSWKEVSEKDRSGIHTDLTNLNRFMWGVGGALIVIQVALGIFGPSIAHALGVVK